MHYGHLCIDNHHHCKEHLLFLKHWVQKVACVPWKHVKVPYFTKSMLVTAHDLFLSGQTVKYTSTSILKKTLQKIF